MLAQNAKLCLSYCLLKRTVTSEERPNQPGPCNAALLCDGMAVELLQAFKRTLGITVVVCLLIFFLLTLFVSFCPGWFDWDLIILLKTPHF